MCPVSYNITAKPLRLLMRNECVSGCDHRSVFVVMSLVLCAFCGDVMCDLVQCQTLCCMINPVFGMVG